MLNVAQRRVSIYSVIKDNYGDGGLRQEEVNKILSNIDEELSPINDIEAIEVENKGKHKNKAMIVDELLMVIESINISEIKSWKVLEDVLRGIDFKVVEVIDMFIEQFKDYFLTSKVSRLFTELFYKTTHIEIFKLAIEVTGLYCNKEMLEDYIMVAHHKEFVVFIYLVLMKWKKKRCYRRALLMILPETEEWLTVKLIQYLIREDYIMREVEYQRDILVYGIKNITNKGEIVYLLAYKLDMTKLHSLSKDDKELDHAINELYYILFFAEELAGGIWYLKNCVSQIENYYFALKEKSVNGETLFGIMNLQKLLNDKELEDEIEDNVKLKGIKDNCNSYMKEIYSKEAVIESIKNEERFDAWTEFAINKKIKEIVPILEDKLQKSPSSVMAIKGLEELGEKPQLELLYNVLKELYDFRIRNKGVNCFEFMETQETQERDSIIMLIESLGKFQNEDSLLYLEKSIEDFDPKVREQAVKTLSKYPEKVYNDRIVMLIKRKLKDSTNYIRKAALVLCIDKGIYITKEEAISIINYLESREGANFREYSEQLKEIIN